MTTPSIRRSTTSLKPIDLPQGFGAVEDLMRVLVKAIRAQQLYAANNPMHKTALDALRSSFTAVWRETPELVLTVTETDLRWSGIAVLSEATKSSDNLAWLFYKDGIRDLRFAVGVEETEIIRFLEIINRARKATIDDDDLVTMLWEADLAGLTYGYIDPNTGGDSVEVANKEPEGPAAGPGEIQARTSKAASEAKISGVVNMADFDSTLHFLDEREVDYLRLEIAREYQQDLRTNIVAALLDVFEQQTSDGVREEILDHVETMLAFLLASGSFRGVAYLLSETAEAATRADMSPEVKSRVAALSERLSAPSAVEQLLEALDDSPVLPPRDELALLFDQLRPTALGTVFSWLPRVRAEQLKALVTDVADRLATANMGEVVKLIGSTDDNVSNEAMRRAGALKAPSAVPAIAKIIGDADSKRRQIAASALAEIASTGALHALERCVADSDRDVRIIAARSLASRGHRPALARLEPIIRGKEIRAADVTEKMAFFESYGAVCGDDGVPSLDAMLNGKGLLGRRDDPEMRAAAAAGLGRIGTTKARESLQHAAMDKEVIVRNAVARSLRGPNA